ncbi:MAG TPA: GDSL-type esterase/lipase family protein, partial [Myxococcota bacterium]|nr:GDSL-type esterase/lipase family protein [Myxococcota bacterium]
FGVAGYSVFQGLEVYRHKVRRFAPAVVVIAFGAFNEAAPADPPAEERARVTQAPANQILFQLDAALLRFRWYQLLRFAVAELRGERAIAERNMERYEANFARWEAGEGWRPEVDVESFGRLLAALVRESQADGARVLLVSPPRSPDVEGRLPALLEYTRQIQAVGERTGVPVCPVRHAFREAGEPLLIDSMHPTARGHQRYAELVAACLRRDGIVGD